MSICENTQETSSSCGDIKAPPRTRREYLERCKERNKSFIDMLGMDGRRIFIEYPRKDKLCRPEGCLVAYERTDGTLSIGWSAYNEKREKTPFSKRDALRRAIDRAVTRDGDAYAITEQDVPRRLHSGFIGFLRRVRQYQRESIVD